jgi:glycosyltransferase involved in cell wall biosynthesis
MNMPSHHQSAFFKALSDQENVDLQVRYFEKVPDTRKKLGWKDEKNLQSNEQYISSIDEINISLPDWKERVHIITGFTTPFLKSLVDFAIIENLLWVHWSERSGVGLAKRLHFNYGLMDLFYPLFLHLRGYKKYAKKVNKYALGSFAIGQLAKNDFLKWGINGNKIEFLPYSLDGLVPPIEISIKLKKSDEMIFMYAGSLYKLKGIDLLINAFQKLSNKSDRWRLVLVGDDRSNNAYFKQVEQLGLVDRVEFTGVVQSDKINEYLAQADVFVLPTRFDGWGAVLNEAASLGKPLISTDQAGAAFHLIKDGENGFMVKAGDADALAKAMKYYVDNPEMTELHGKKSFEIFQKYTPEENSRHCIKCIQKFLKEVQ